MMQLKIDFFFLLMNIVGKKNWQFQLKSNPNFFIVESLREIVLLHLLCSVPLWWLFVTATTQDAPAFERRLVPFRGLVEIDV